MRTLEEWADSLSMPALLVVGSVTMMCGMAVIGLLQVIFTQLY